MTIEDEKINNETKTVSKTAVDASIRSIKKAARSGKITHAKPEALPTPKQKKKKPKNGFERELGVNGAKERANAAAEGKVVERPKRKAVAGGSAGKKKQSFSSKREGKASKRS